MSAPTTPSEWIAAQVAADTPRMLAEFESAGHAVTPLVRGLVEILLRDLYERGLEKALAGVLPDISAGDTEH
jgi:hypothetical protein